MQNQLISKGKSVDESLHKSKLDIPAPLVVHASLSGQATRRPEDSTQPSVPLASDSPAAVALPVKVESGTSKTPFPFATPEEPVIRRSLKRRRPDSDVDGPNTASMGCKKRRLLRYLITSRLSQPFSLPATHILNREAVATGDKRFLKLAAIMAARRLISTVRPHTPQHYPSQSSLLRRAAMINRFRLRVKNHASEKGDMDVAQLAANSTVLQQSHGLGLVVGARFPVPPVGSVPHPPTPVLRMPMHFKPQHHPPHPLSKAAAKAQLSPPGSPAGLVPTHPTSPALRLPPSPNLLPIRSPELRSTRLTRDLDDDDDDDDIMSFPGSDLDSKYEASDDHDDVYADFGVIFGGTSDGDGSDEDAEHYEDYMDDLDGIPWSAR